jgi:2-C-methyl-D-erythritol 4-phosphate cytidylyltransferase
MLVVRPEDLPLAQEVLRREAAGLDVRLVVGGPTRHASEDAALAALGPQVEGGELDVVAGHDAARPLAGASLFRSVIEVADAVGGAVPALPALGVLRAGDDGRLLPAGSAAALGVPAPASDEAACPEPRRLARVQTPQAFRAKDLLAAYAAAHETGYQGTDTASSVEAFSGLVVRTVAGSPLNLKVTYPHDLAVAERLLSAQGRRFD